MPCLPLQPSCRMPHTASVFKDPLFGGCMCVPLLPAQLPKLRSAPHITPTSRHCVSTLLYGMVLWRLLRTTLRFRFVRGLRVVGVMWAVATLLSVKMWRGGCMQPPGTPPSIAMTPSPCDPSSPAPSCGRTCAPELQTP